MLGCDLKNDIHAGCLTRNGPNNSRFVRFGIDLHQSSMTSDVIRPQYCICRDVRFGLRVAIADNAEGASSKGMSVNLREQRA